jgi:glycerophosphoryl diester phosphodiesterase
MKRLAITLALSALAFGTTAHAFEAQGHRGARGLAPENTIEGFKAALSIGVTTLELDLGMTRDGVVVVAHDPKLNPDITRGQDGRFLDAYGSAIHSLTLEQLQRYDVGRIKPGSAYAARFPAQQGADGVRIPRLADVFELVRSSGASHIRFNIETKLTPTSGADVPDPESFAQAVAAAIRAAKLESRVAVQSFDWRTLIALKRIAPEIERVCLTVEADWEDNLARGKAGPSPWTAGFDIDDVGGSAPRLAAAAGCAVWSPYFRNVNEASIADARAAKVKVIPWTVNERADMERLIGLGVDGIITDYPDRLRPVLAGRGMKMPMPVAVK